MRPILEVFRQAAGGRAEQVGHEATCNASIRGNQPPITADRPPITAYHVAIKPNEKSMATSGAPMIGNRESAARNGIWMRTEAQAEGSDELPMATDELAMVRDEL